jgi:hypothetical protein
MEFAINKHDVTDIEYRIFLDFLQMGGRQVKGVVDIKAKLRVSARSLSLRYCGRVLSVEGVQSYDFDSNTLTLTFENEALDRLFHVSFESEVRDEPVGLFERFGSDSSCLFCQGEPYGIEKVFPCLNDPGLKTNFKVYARVQRYQKCYSNQAKSRKILSLKDLKDNHFESLVSKSLDEKGKILIFKKMRRISIHLFTICVGNFYKYKQRIQIQKLESGENTSLALRVLIPESLINIKAPFVEQVFFEISKFGIDYYIEKFQIDFPYEKVDWVFTDFGFSAMENPGLITVNKSNLNMFPKNNFLACNRVRMILHELCHSYFGNMVSICGWRDIWFKEAFTEFWCQQAHQSYVEKGLNSEAGEVMNIQIYKFIKFFYLISDTISNPHSLVPSVLNEDNFYSHTVYYKGVKILDVISKMCGLPTFEKFSQIIVKKFKDSAISSDELFSEFEDHCLKESNLVNKHIEPLIREDDLEGIRKSQDKAFTFGSVFNLVKPFLFNESKFLIFEVRLNTEKREIEVNPISGIVRPFYAEFEIFDQNFNSKGIVRGIMGLTNQSLTIDIKSSIPNLDENDFVVPIMNESGYFIYLHDEKTLDRLISNAKILEITNLSMRYYIYLFTSILRKYLPSEKGNYITELAALLETEEHPMFQFVKYSF